MRHPLIAALAAIGLAAAMPSLALAQAAPETGYAPVNGLELYYEVHGAGEPLVLLHGGLGAAAMFGPILATLAEGHQVIAVDLQGHGHTADIDRPLSYEAMADDVAALVAHLGLDRVDIMGYSLGGGVALQTAIRHPEAVRRLVLVSTAFRRDGWHPEVLAQQEMMGPEAAAAMLETPIYQAYAAVAPRVEDWPRLVTKVADLLRQDYDWGDDVTAIAAPVLIVAADADAVRLAHTVELYGLFGGGQRDAGFDLAGRSPNAQLAILPGTTHYDIFMSPALAAVAVSFLDAPATTAQ